MKFGIIGLGRMGGSLARLAMDKGHRVAGYNKAPPRTQVLAKEGLDPAFSLAELVQKLEPPRILVIYVPHGAPTETTITELKGLLEPSDVVADGGNSHWRDSVRHYEDLKASGLSFLDVGTSGGIDGARTALASWSRAMPTPSPKLSPCSATSPSQKAYSMPAPRAPAIS